MVKSIGGFAKSVILLGALAGLPCCSDEDDVCSRDSVAKFVSKKGSESSTVLGELMAEMVQTQMGDSERTDKSGQTKFRYNLSNIRTEEIDKPHKRAYCSAILHRHYFVRFSSGSTEDNDSREHASKISYVIEIADNGELMVSTVEVE